MKLLQLFNIKFAVVGVHSPNIFLLDSVKYWNRKLRKFCLTKNIVYYENQTYVLGSKILKEFIGNSIHNDKIPDHVHLSNKLGEYFYESYKDKYTFEVHILDKVTILKYDDKFKVYRYKM